MAALNNERDWLLWRQPVEMMRFLDGFYSVTNRKWLLFGSACCRLFWDYIPDTKARRAILTAEAFADGAAGILDLQNAAYDASCADDAISPGSSIYMAILWLCSSTGGNQWCFHVLRHLPLNTHQEFLASCLLRDIVELPLDRNIMNSNNLASSWRTPAVLGLGKTLYEDRKSKWGHLDFVNRLILADALEDAGCEDILILEHLRDVATACVRGCWVLDLLLYKS